MCIRYGVYTPYCTRFTFHGVYTGFIHFADDTAVLLEVNNLDIVCTVMNGELEQVHDWLCSNKLSLNERKTFYMVFSNTSSRPINDIKIGGHKIAQVESSKYLGVIIDNHPSFKHHINHVLRKMPVSLGLLQRLFLYTQRYVLRTIYLSLEPGLLRP